MLGTTNMHEHVSQSCFTVAQLTFIVKREIVFWLVFNYIIESCINKKKKSGNLMFTETNNQC